MSLFHSLCIVCIYVLLLQISMSVNWIYIHAIPMPTALTQRAALTAHVVKVLKAMGSTVQVQDTFYTSTILLHAYCICMHMQSIQIKPTSTCCTHLFSDYLYIFFYVDISECERGLDDCNQNANCINMFGSYSCICKTGFTGDGFTCAG